MDQGADFPLGLPFKSDFNATLLWPQSILFQKLLWLKTNKCDTIKGLGDKLK